MRLICPEQKNFSQTGKQILSKHFDCTFLDIDNEKDLNNLISEFDILLIRFKLKISKKTLLNSTNLKFIICPTTGLDHIDLDTTEKLGIKLFSLKNQSTFLRKVPSTAELTILLILTLLRNYNQASRNVKTFLWRSNLERGFELSDKKIGIIGLGRLGRIVSKICYAFGAKIYFFDIDSNINYKKYNRVSSIKELFETSDIVSIHIPLNNHTKNLIDINIFKQKKFNCKFLINTSRGEIINSKSLIYALETQKIKGAGLDVIDKEEKNKELINFSIKNDNLIITPHIGGYTYEAVEKTDKFLINNFLKYINNGKNYN